MSASVSITIDVDGTAGLPDGGRASGRRLSSRSERLYGLRRGLPRILDVLTAFGAKASFYVPGVVAERHPDDVRGIVAGGHEVGHHGHRHLRPDRLSPTEQRAELRDGLAALTDVAGVAIRGYRAPEWELAPATLAALPDHGFTHDSSLMGDDRPYRVRSGAAEVVELPVHWTLDDAPHFAHTTDPRGLLVVWLAELSAAVADARHLTYTLHPEILGRPHRIDVLRRLLEAAREGAIPIRQHRDIAAELLNHPAPEPRSSAHRYEAVVEGSLTCEQLERLEGWSVTRADETGTTTLASVALDQAALFGAMLILRHHRRALVSLRRR
jgi:peptidoglycan/xylan/chitin deacetylase (PgdA/CDA1 family)